MEISANSRAPSTAAPPPVSSRADTAPNVQAVRTQLPAAKSVSAVNTTQDIRADSKDIQAEVKTNDSQSPTLGSPNLERALSFDKRTNEVIFQVLNQNTGEVVRQFPEESVLRMRALYREAEQRKSQASENAAVNLINTNQTTEKLARVI
jgi:uncharacterized FlaG/YvyC family protein